MELVHAKLERGLDMEQQVVYQMTWVFGSPFTDSKGKHIGGATPVHMSFMNGMPPEDFAEGLRQLADHIEENHSSSTVEKKLRLVEDDNTEG